MFYMHIYANHGGRWINVSHREYSAVHSMYMISQVPKDVIKTDAVKPTFHMRLIFYSSVSQPL